MIALSSCDILLEHLLYDIRILQGSYVLIFYFV